MLRADDLDRISQQIRARSRTWRLWSAVWVFLLIFLSWIWFAFWDFRAWSELEGGWDHIIATYGTESVAIAVGAIGFIILVMGACGFYAGAFFGTIAGQGGLASFIADTRTPLRLRPDHFDGATGMKPIGDLYLLQALLTGVPLLWYSIWWVIIPAYDKAICADIEYGVWRWPFVFAWLTTLGYTYLGFIRPVLKLRKRLRDYKSDLMAKDVPAAKARIYDLQSRLMVEGVSEEGKERLLSEIDGLSYKVWCIQNMSVWPMDLTTRRRYFSLNTGLTVVPPLIQVLAGFGAFQAYLPEELNWRWFKALGSMLL